MRLYFSKGPLQAYAYLLFILIYFPCVAAFGAAIREMGRGFGILSAVYLTLLAWVTATLFYPITVGHNVLWILVPVLLFALLVVLFRIIGNRVRGVYGREI